jgi:hypothetical protein
MVIVDDETASVQQKLPKARTPVLESMKSSVSAKPKKKKKKNEIDAIFGF